jgi:hypothetical protein
MWQSVLWQSVQVSIETATDRQSVEINTELVCLTYTNLVLRIWREESFPSFVEVKVEPLSLNILHQESRQLSADGRELGILLCCQSIVPLQPTKVTIIIREHPSCNRSSARVLHTTGLIMMNVLFGETMSSSSLHLVVSWHF